MAEATSPEPHTVLTQERLDVASDNPTPLVQGAGCSACVGFRYYPFLRSCAYWWNQYALAL